MTDLASVVVDALKEKTTQGALAVLEKGLGEEAGKALNKVLNVKDVIDNCGALLD
ncbi:hypothetical protein [Corynebacterium otitidis]|uniref:Uncharacterized protein n=1 Tax=Corynebacterium otitidis ATCC 51513 TaxID=883169 RepID=K0YH30_9CORY|nr:hypothetical protein [Corynebacterium otitidis]EJZ82872.1 hypothetical protein HMPREF9719_00195 [Corynebacterium otitidis ATCC 51513]